MFVEAEWRSSNGNLSTGHLSQRDNLVEEIITPVPFGNTVESNTDNRIVDSKPLSPCSISQSSTSSTSKTFFYIKNTLKRERERKKRGLNIRKRFQFQKNLQQDFFSLYKFQYLFGKFSLKFFLLLSSI